MYKTVGEIYAGFEKTRAILLAKIESLNPEQENARENNQGWSIKEIVEHIGIVENGSLKIAGKLLVEAETTGAKSDGTISLPADFAEKLQSVATQKLEAPERIHPQGQQSLADSLAKLAQSTDVLKDMRPRIEAVDASQTAFPHPFFGNLNLYQWIIMLGLHERRHLEQIKRILESN